MRRLLIAIVLSIIAVGLGVGLYLYNKPHKDIRTSEVNFSLTVVALAGEFQANQNQAFQKYADKVIQLSGNLDLFSKPDDGPVTLVIRDGDGVANCEMDSLFNIIPSEMPVGSPVAITGLFVGYDDLLGELQLKKCFVNPNN